MLNVRVSTARGAGSVNEDVAGHHGNAAWVIDGATGVGEALHSGLSDAAWFANRFDQELRLQLHERPKASTRDLLAATIEACALAFRARCPGEHDPADLPSAAFAMVRQMGNTLELTTIGDCRVAYRPAAGVAALFGGDALGPFEARTIALAVDLRSANPQIEQAALRQALLPHLRATRRLMNKPGGYWILGFDPAAADQVDQLVVPVETGDRFALATDGFLRLVELFGVAKPVDLLAIDTQGRFERQLERLRAMEAEPGSLTRHPRIKAHDDVGFVHCEFLVEG